MHTAELASFALGNPSFRLLPRDYVLDYPQEYVEGLIVDGVNVLSAVNPAHATSLAVEIIRSLQDGRPVLGRWKVEVPVERVLVVADRLRAPLWRYVSDQRVDVLEARPVTDWGVVPNAVKASRAQLLVIDSTSNLISDAHEVSGLTLDTAFRACEVPVLATFKSARATSSIPSPVLGSYINIADYSDNNLWVKDEAAKATSPAVTTLLVNDLPTPVTGQLQPPARLERAITREQVQALGDLARTAGREKVTSTSGEDLWATDPARFREITGTDNTQLVQAAIDRYRQDFEQGTMASYAFPDEPPF